MTVYDVSSDKDGKKEGLHCSYAAGFILLLLAVCMALLVGLIVHFTSPGQVVCNFGTPKIELPELSQEELKGRCINLVQGGEMEICTKCKTTQTTSSTQSFITSLLTTTTKTTTTTTTTVTTPAPKINYRLPESLRPVHYDIELQPEIYGNNASLFTFNGTVTITINVTESTPLIILHKKGIDVAVASLTASDGSMAPSVINATDDFVREFYIIQLDRSLDIRVLYELKMTFHAKLGTTPFGLYLSSYHDDNMNTVYLATTQFEATHAREAFPCFDEPALKATFDITLIRKKDTGRNYTTLANTETISSDSRGDYIADKHARTVVMPTYLLAFIVCDFDYHENVVSNTKYRTFSRPNAIQYVDRAHDYGQNLFQWFNNKFRPPYPLTKLDNIAIPDFASLGMENWGLVTYKEAILYIPGVTTTPEDSQLVLVLSHEIAHQWFGNIVSPKWWRYLWLNEGFAAFWDFSGVDAVYPERRVEDQFVTVSMQAALDTDGNAGSRPLTNSAENSYEISTLFDIITYYKGSSIVRMVQFIMGDDMFTRALNLYLDRHQYSAAENKDLFGALNDQAAQDGVPLNMTDIMDSWVTLNNYPLLTVKVVGPGVINVEQERYTDTVVEPSDEYRWTIPITIATSADTSIFAKSVTYGDIKWLHHSESEKNISDLSIPNPNDANGWVLANINRYGFYRVNYEESNWMSLISALETDHEIFPPLVRGQLINDAWTLYRVGRVTFGIALRTFNFLKNDIDFAPWQAFLKEIDYLEKRLGRTNLYNAFKMYMRQAMAKVYKKFRLNIQDDSMATENIRAMNGGHYACMFGVEECVDDVKIRFQQWMDVPENNRPNQNIINVVLCNGVRYGGLKEWKFVYSQFVNSTDYLTRNAALSAMLCTRQPWLVERTVYMTQDDPYVNKANTVLLLQLMSRMPGTRDVLWNWMRTSYTEIDKRLSILAILTILREVSTGLTTQGHLNELSGFANATVGMQNFGPGVAAATQTTLKNVAFMNTAYDVIKEWLVEAGFDDYLP